MKNQIQNNNRMLNRCLELISKTMTKMFVIVSFLSLLSSYNLSAQCSPTCKLENVGMYMWMGDNDNQSLGDATSDDEDGDDFIVYKNYGTSPVDISGWQLYTDVAGSTTPVFTFPSGTILQPNETATVVADWNAGPALPVNWFDANFNVGGEGLFEEISNNVSYAILKNPTTNQYITVHQQGTASAGQSLASGTKVCNTNVTNLVTTDFEGCEVVYWDFNTCTYKEVTDCTIPNLNNCLAGTTAPSLTATTKTNTCPTTTVDLTTITATNQPSGTTLTWHTATPATAANKITGTAVSAGTYYAAFFDAGKNCYSGTNGSATTAVTATSSACSGPLAAGNPAPKTAVVGTPITGNAATELTPTGGTAPYVYSNGIGDPACTAVSGATALPVGNLTVTNSSTGAYTVTPPTTPGTYYYCIKICDSSATPVCVVKTYTLTVTAACNAGSTAPILIKN
jgi:hypothetical protein